MRRDHIRAGENLMKTRRSVVLALAAFLTAPVFDGQTEQTPTSFPNELAVLATKKAISNDSTDLSALAKSVQAQNIAQNAEFNIVMQLDVKASSSIEELDATLWFLAVYDHMQCDPDRDIAKQALVNRLGLYAHLLELRADQPAGNVGFAKLPATVQAGARLKDDMRSAKATLDDIVATLK
jgi:hypothetical protein